MGLAKIETDGNLITEFENALIDLIERYVDDGLTNANIRAVLDARRDDDHEYRDEPPVAPAPTR